MRERATKGKKVEAEEEMRNIRQEEEEYMKRNRTQRNIME